MDKKFVIYDPPMCCSSGMCGPNPDQTLINIQSTITGLRKSGVEIERYIINQSPEKFKENSEVIKLIQKHQLKALPITTYDGKVVKMGAYPTLDEFRAWYPGDLPDKFDSLVTVPDDEGCCADQDSCDISCGPQKSQPSGKCC
jgi:hypothetical protein